jgi:hypothetical protein
MTEETKNEQNAENKPRKRKKLITVEVLAEHDESTLVSWLANDAIQRCYVPNNSVEDGKVEKDELEAGIPYGVPWGELATILGLPEKYAKQFEGALHRRNVWRASDMERNPKAAIAALVEVTHITASALRRAANELEDQ